MISAGPGSASISTSRRSRPRICCFSVAGQPSSPSICQHGRATRAAAELTAFPASPGLRVCCPCSLCRPRQTIKPAMISAVYLLCAFVGGIRARRVGADAGHRRNYQARNRGPAGVARVSLLASTVRRTGLLEILQMRAFRSNARSRSLIRSAIATLPFVLPRTSAFP